MKLPRAIEDTLYEAAVPLTMPPRFWWAHGERHPFCSVLVCRVSAHSPVGLYDQEWEGFV